MAKVKAPFQEDVIALERSIEETLFSINRLDDDPSLDLIFELDSEQKNFVPQKMLAFGSELYFYNPFSHDLYQINIETKDEKLSKASQNLKLGSAGNMVLLFTEPNVFFLQETGFSESELVLPYPNFSFDVMATFKTSLYFLDKNSGEIVRYFRKGENEWSVAESWLQDGIERQTYSGAVSMTIDGNIWCQGDC